MLCLSTGSVLFPSKSFLVVMWDATTMRVQLSPACVDSILAAISSGRLGQDLLVFQFPRLLVLIAAVANLIPVGLLHMSVLAQEQKIYPLNHPSRVITVMH